MRVNKKNGKIKFSNLFAKRKMGVAPAGSSVRSRAFQCSVAYVPLHSKAGFRQAQPPLLNGCAALPIANAKKYHSQNPPLFFSTQEVHGEHIGVESDSDRRIHAFAFVFLYMRHD